MVADLHRSFFDVGCDVVETDSFGSLPWVLAEYGLADRTRELAAKAARIAREVAGGYARAAGWPARSGPGTKIASLGQITFVDQRDGYQEAAARAARRAASTCFIIETVQDLLQAKAAIIGCRRAMADAGRPVPIQVQVTIETTGRMLMGTEIGAALTTLDALRPDVIGLNCATGPGRDERAPALPVPAAPGADLVLPNAGLPSVVDGPHALRPDPRPAGRAPRPLRHRVRRSAWSAAAAAPPPSTCAAVVGAVPRT